MTGIAATLTALATITARTRDRRSFVKRNDKVKEKGRDKEETLESKES